MIKRRPDLTHEEFCEYWREKHGPLVASMVPWLTKYVQNHPLGTRGSEYEFDGIAEMWFEDFQEFRQFLAWRKTGEAKALIDDEKEFLGDGLTGYVVEEYSVK
jgi:uncharacterized protein (TIGR02118 family)